MPFPSPTSTRALLPLLGLVAVCALPLAITACSEDARAGGADCSGFTAEDGSPDFEPDGRPSGVLPDTIGKGLQCSQEALRAQGFTSASHDATGARRTQARDKHWKVCFQAPAPGSQNPMTQVQFGTVKLDEACPDHDVGAEQLAAEVAAAKAEARGDGSKTTGRTERGTP